MAIHAYWPEMGDQKPICDIEANLCHYGKHYFLRTALPLKGRGIEYLKTYENGQHSYQVTLRAFEKLQEQSSVAYRFLLD